MAEIWKKQKQQFGKISERCFGAWERVSHSVQASVDTVRVSGAQVQCQGQIPIPQSIGRAHPKEAPFGPRSGTDPWKSGQSVSVYTVKR